MHGRSTLCGYNISTFGPLLRICVLTGLHLYEIYNQLLVYVCVCLRIS